jgi:hypothetical protein
MAFQEEWPPAFGYFDAEKRENLRDDLSRFLDISRDNAIV